MSGVGVADDVIRSFFERWKNLEAEKAAISEDLRELFAEMKGSGFDTKVARKVFRDKTVDQNERAEFEAIYDLYWSALSGPRAGRAREEREVTTPNTSNSGVNGSISVDLATTPKHEPQPSGNSDVGNPTSTEPVITHSPETAERGAGPEKAPASDGGAVSALKAQGRMENAVGVEPSPSNNSTPAERGQHDHGGQHVGRTDDEQYHEAPVSGAERGRKGADGVDQGQGAGASGTDRQLRAVSRIELGQDQDGRSGDVGGEARHQIGSSDLHDGRLQAVPAPALDESRGSAAGVEAPAAPVLYPAPGIVTYERCPPEPVRWHEYADCFPETEVLLNAAGVQRPIVKIGNVILDGRSRYHAARDAGIEYPVVQYAGPDPLTDMIRLNLESRNMSEKDKRAVASRLSKLVPDRTDEIMVLFGLEMAEAMA